MSPRKKMICKVCLKGCTSIIVGVGFVTLFSVLLTSYVDNKDARVRVEYVDASDHIAFPENEKMLEEMAALLKQEAVGLAEVNPSAGAK